MDFYEIYSSISKNYLSDKRIIKEFKEGNTSGIANFDLQKEGFASMMDALKLVAPKSSYEILKACGFLHGTGTWLRNAERLIKDGVCIAEIPATRDDLFMLLHSKLQNAGYSDTGIAYELTEKIRRGKIDANSQLILSSLDLPEWFLSYCEKIKYMFPKAHAASMLQEALAFMWFKIHFPKEFEDICIGEI